MVICIPHAMPNNADATNKNHLTTVMMVNTMPTMQDLNHIDHQETQCINSNSTHLELPIEIPDLIITLPSK